MTNPRIGAHVSISGGVHMAPKRANDLGCETFQCFTRPPQGGPAPILTQTIIANFKSQMKECDFETFYIHTPYYINFASLEPRIRLGSIKVVREELERGSLLGARYVMTHLGSHTGQTLEDGIAKVADAINQAFDGYQGTTQLLLEIAAGTGNIIGDTFDEIGEILRQLGLLIGGTCPVVEIGKTRTEGAGKIASNSNFHYGVCFDTCHAFASGYDFRTAEGVKNVLEEFNTKIGLEFLKLAHVNDSKVDLGGRRDRHEHINDGFIGKNGLANILNATEFRSIDWLLETDDSKREADIKILKEIRGF
ncbi:MAG: deoxyribonuclease IV [Candidatus Yanofskybacteria bacterium]|nr:deoxyribonuclease IV [Candidatus Yanofskybacteria bacterium]